MTARRQLGTASDSLALVARLMALASQPGEDALATAIAGEAAALLRVPAAAVIAGSDCDGEARIASSREPIRAVPAAELGPIAALVASGEDHARLHGAEAALPVGDASHPCAILLRLSGETVRVLALTGSEDDVLDPATLTLGLAFAEAASAAFTHQATGLAHRRTAGQHAALARAAKTLNESLDLSTLLARICQEAATVTSADSAVVYRLTGDDALAVEAAHGLPPEHIGFRLAPGAGLAGKVIKADRPMMTENYGEVGQPSAESPWKGVKASVAVPVHWGGELRGVLAVAYWSPIRLTQQHLDGLEAFAELAAVAFQNASAHAGLAHAARTDPLTGCLNHAAVHEGLAREIERAERTPGTADQVGSAMRSAVLYERLERAYLGTAEALAAALAAKDAYTADHARSIAGQAEAVGRRLGMDEPARRDLRLGAVFHDIGKIAVPEAILNKPGPLDPEERAVIERHTLVGERILAPVEFLAGVCRLVRHEHERWDGGGCPTAWPARRSRSAPASSSRATRCTP